MKLAQFIAVILVVTLVGCSKQNKIPSQAQGAASGSLPDNVKEVFPHSVEFKATKVHGQFYQKNNDTCKTCHGADLTGAGTQVACNSCHAIYPHTTEFKTKTHGSKYLEERALCSRCHGAELKGDSAKPACSQCHAYPHTPEWTLPSNHGTQYVESKAKFDANLTAKTNKADLPNPTWQHCTVCHVGTAEKKATGTSCGSCHVVIPHEEGWVTNDPPAHKGPANTFGGKCINCHSDFKRLMSPDYADNGGCKMCHADKVMNPPQWTDPVTPPSGTPSVSAAESRSLAQSKKGKVLTYKEVQKKFHRPASMKKN